MPAQIDFNISQKFRCWFFLSMLMLLFVHSYNLNQRYLQPFTIVDERLTITSFVQYFFSNGLFRFFVPLFFSISGYLYAAHDNRSYRKSIGKRFQNLVLPYLIWSAWGLLLTYALELSSYGRHVVLTTQLMTLSHNRILLHDYKWYEIILRWILLPVSYQLWFLRVLFIYNLAYPALRWAVQSHAKIIFAILILFWLSEIGFLFVEGEGLLFFSLGIWLQKKDFNIQAPNKWLRPVPWGIAFVIIAAFKTILAFKGFGFIGNAVFPLLLLLHKTVVCSGLIAAWFGSGPLVRWFMAKKWFVQLCPFSFMIYVLHAPLVAYAINALLPLVPQVADWRLVVYMLLPLALLLFCVLTALIIKITFPKMYSVMTGGRGI